MRTKGEAEAPPSWLPQEIDTSDTGEVEDDDRDEEDGQGLEERSKLADLSPEELAHIETLFEDASADRDKALELKAELDRCGVFKDYEDRFLDLFAG